MKAIHLAIIVIFTICSTVGIGTAYAYGSDGGYLTTLPPLYHNTMNLTMHTNLTSPALQAPQPSVPPSITVNTNLENYSTGDKIVISGHISSPNDKTPLVIKIFNPNHEMSFNKLFPPSLNQSYAWTVSTVAFWEFLNSGNYTVLTQYGQDYATTHFYLNSTLTQYLYSQSPLWQYNNGMPAQDVHCHADLKLVIRAENSEPACVSQITATKLVLRGWALPPPPKEPYINKIGITGLQLDYTVGQTINATVVYSGYYWYTEPEVKIFDSNGTQIWFNCPFCYARTEPIQTPSFGTFTYQVIEYGTRTLPMINKTGNYTMVASLESKSTEANFTIITSQTPENQNSNQTVSIASIKQVPPVTPGGPTIQLTLKNISNKPITSLKAILEVNNNYTFDFVNVTSSKPLVPNNSTSETQILIGAGFQTDALHPVIITGTEDNTQFTYIENAYIQ